MDGCKDCTRRPNGMNFNEKQKIPTRARVYYLEESDSIRKHQEGRLPGGFSRGHILFQLDGYLNKKLSLWAKRAHGTDQQHGEPLICALRMAHTRSDKRWEKGEKNQDLRVPHV